MATRFEKKIEVKKALAAKYERLAAVAGSEPKQRTFHFHARRFHAQVAAMQQQLAQRNP